MATPRSTTNPGTDDDGHGGDHDENSEVAEGARTITVNAKPFEFGPATLEAEAGSPAIVTRAWKASWSSREVRGARLLAEPARQLDPRRTRAPGLQADPCVAALLPCNVVVRTQAGRAVPEAVAQ